MSSDSSFPADVIDWTEAMQQTGDDEEFLRELLADLRQETDTQMVNIEQIIQVSIFVHRYEAASPDVKLRRQTLLRIVSHSCLVSPYCLLLLHWMHGFSF